MYELKEKKRTLARSTFIKHHKSEFKYQDIKDSLKKVEEQLKEQELTLKHRDLFLNNLRENNPIIEEIEKTQDFIKAKETIRLLLEGKNPSKAKYKYGKDLVAIHEYIRMSLSRDDVVKNIEVLEGHKKEHDGVMEELKGVYGGE